MTLAGPLPRASAFPQDQQFLEHLFEPPEAWHLDYWHNRPLAPYMVDLSMDPIATDEDREAVQLLKDGWFSPVYLFDPLPIGVPPPWDINPYNSATWDSYRHGLTWTEPLIRVWLTDGDVECLDLMIEVICDWWFHNQEYPGASAYAWRDNPTSRRLERFMWFWEFFRSQAGEHFNRFFARQLLEIIQVHAEYNNNDVYYNPNSNHGLMLNTALLEALAMMPEYRGSETWRETLERRMPTYIEDNFTTLGYYREQTPSYHKYAVSRLGPMAKLLRMYDLDPIPPIDETARTAASLGPFLARRPIGYLANIGDSACSKMRDYWARWEDWWGEDMPSVAPDIIPNPREDQSHFMVDVEVGYAVFTAGELYLNGDDPGPDTYLLFRCNATPYTHTHADALSFMFYGMGHDWLIDSGGPYAYDLSFERQYLISHRAHNVVVVDHGSSGFEPVEPLAYDRTVDGDFVESRHIMPEADHVRRVTFVPPYSMELHDVVTSTDGDPHVYSQILLVIND